MLLARIYECTLRNPLQPVSISEVAGELEIRAGDAETLTASLLEDGMIYRIQREMPADLLAIITQKGMASLALASVS